jgi:hypothetical protein
VDEASDGLRLRLQVGIVDLCPEVFKAPVRRDIIHRVFIWQANSRVPIHTLLCAALSLARMCIVHFAVRRGMARAAALHL